MTTLQEYIDTNASRLYHQLSRRQVNALHDLKNLAQWLKNIQDRRKLSVIRAATIALMIGAYELPVQIPSPEKAPACVEYCEDPEPMPPLLAETGGVR